MKRRRISFAVLLLLAVIISPQTAAAANKNPVWVVVSKTDINGTENKLTSTYTYNSKGLISAEKNGYGSRIYYTYNSRNLLTDVVTKSSGGIVTATKKITYSGKKATKAVTGWPDSDELYIQLYTWKNKGKKLIVHEGFGTKDADANDLITYTLGKNKEYLKTVVKNSISDFTYWYKYDKKTRVVKAYLLDKINGPVKKTLKMTYKYKVNKNGCVTKVTMTVEPSGTKVYTTYRYKKIMVPAGTYKLVKLQQQNLHGWTPEHLELLTY